MLSIFVALGFLFLASSHLDAERTKLAWMEVELINTNLSCMTGGMTHIIRLKQQQVRGVPSRVRERPGWKRLLVVHRTPSFENLENEINIR